MTMKFRFNEEKALAALAFVAGEEPGLSPFFVSKIMFFADKWHVNRFGRPIVGDDYIRMQDGPVPSTIKNYIDENWKRIPKPTNFDAAIRIKRGLWLRWLHAGKGEANQSLLSQTDKDCLQEAVRFCRGKSKEELSELTHHEKAWKQAENGRPMNYEDFVDDDNPHRAEIAAMLRETAAYGVL